MIRFGKPVRVLEWGEGTNTTNQIWTQIAEGTFTSRSVKDGITTMVIEANANVEKKNQKDMSVKLAQESEGMAANSKHWGEVAIGHITSISGRTVTVEIPYATKISGAANLLQRFLNIP